LILRVVSLTEHLLHNAYKVVGLRGGAVVDAIVDAIVDVDDVGMGSVDAF